MQILGLGKLLGKYSSAHLSRETSKRFEKERLVERGRKESAASSGTERSVGEGAG